MTEWHLEGEILLEVEGNSLSLRGEGKEVVLRADAIPQVLRGMGFGQTTARTGLSRLAEYLYQLGLTLRVETPNRLIAVLGRGARGGLFSHLLGIPHAEFKLNRDSLKVLVAQTRNLNRRGL